MNSDPTALEPDDDRTAADLDADAVDTIALDAVTAVAPPLPAPEDDPAFLSDASDPMVGRRLGAYRLLARRGGGDSGSVYLAERVAGPEHRVAVKRIALRADGAAIVRRFHDEVDPMAATTRHPNIAGLLDAGTDEDGRAYLVMEYVDGRRIDEYCDDRRLDVPARLRLFAQVCDAVQFIHRHAAILRDLEPRHILVTAEGVPRLVGFGVTGLTVAAAGARPLTTEYASPEQVIGEPPTTSSDVYAMGVVLYRLLTGRGPYRLRTGDVAEVFQAICEQAPERPSRAVVSRRPKRPAAVEAGSDPIPPIATIATLEPGHDEAAAARGTTPAGLSRILAGDLDAIVLMAMRTEPERRYLSAGELAEDLREYLAGRPVRARGDSTIGRLGKLVRRNAAIVAVAAALGISLVGVVVGTSWGLLRARRDRDRAEASALQARRAVDRFFARVSEERRLEEPGLHSLRGVLLEDARKFYESFAAERAGDPTARAEVAGALSRLGKITMEIGSTAEAAAGLRRAITQWEDVVRSRPDDPEVQEQLARTLDDEAIVLMRLDDRQGDALDASRRAVAILEPLVAGSPSVALRRELGFSLRNIAQIRFKQGDPDQAIESLQRSMAIDEQLAAEDAGALDPRISMARAHGLLAQILAAQPDGLKPALVAAQRAVDVGEAIVREHPELSGQTYTLAIDEGDLSTFQQMDGRLDSALKSGRRAIELLDGLDRQFPGTPRYRGALGSSLNMVSDLHRRRGEPAESLAVAEKARTLLERLVAEHPRDAASRIDLSRSFNTIGRLQQQSGEPVEARRSFQRAVDLLEGLNELDPRENYLLACDLALCIPLIGAKPGSQGVEDEETLSKGDRIRRSLYGDRAIEVLRRAVRSGFVDTETLQSDPDLAAIRDREDFRQLAKDMEKPATGRE